MSAAAKPELSFEQQLRILTGKVEDAHQHIRWMRQLGGFTDAKTLSMRSARLEERVEKLERDRSMLIDVVNHLVDFAVEHSRDRHDADIKCDNAPEIISLRRIKRRTAEWLEACRPRKRAEVMAD